MSNPFSGDPKDRKPDGDYLSALEKRLKGVKDKKKIDSKSIIKDIDSLRNDQLFKLLSQSDVPLPTEEQKFENDFIEEQSILDKPIEPSLIRKKVAPQTCATNKTELVSILKYDVTQRLHEFYQQLDKTTEERLESEEILREIQEVAKELAKQDEEEKNGESSSSIRSEENTTGSETQSWKDTKFYALRSQGTRKSLQKCNRMHILFSDLKRPWETPLFKKTDCFSCVLTWDGILAMTTDKQRRRSRWKEVDLIKLLPVEPSTRAGIFELVCSDVSLEQSGDCLAILAVFWIEVDKLNTPTKCFGSVFRISKSLQVKFCQLIEVPSMVAYCRLTDRKTFTHDYHCLIIFPKGAEVSAYLVDANSIQRIDDVFEWFPSLALTNLPGGALRTSCIICDEHRFSAVGLDTGILIVSVCMIQGNVILDSVRLKFACPLTVVEFLPQVSPSIQRILVSSYLGPAAIWRVHFNDDKLRWEQECTFVGSQYYDSVLCACVYRFYHGAAPWILLGTYSGKILRYELPVPTATVRKSKQQIKMFGKPCLAMVNRPIYSMKQTGLNEISVVTLFGLAVLRESLKSTQKHSDRAYRCMEKYQVSRFCKNQKKLLDFSNQEIRRASREAKKESQIRVPSTASIKKNLQSGSVSSSSSNSKLNKLEVETYYQDGPSEQEQKSPNKTAIAQSPKMEAIQESALLSERRMSSSSLFRFLPKKSSDQSLGKVFK